MAAFDVMNAWIVGGDSDGVILRTRDGGASWQEQAIPPGADMVLEAVYALDMDTVWAVGGDQPGL